MSLTKQAKVLSEVQIKTTLSHISTTRLATRNTALMLLSVDAGLRAKEIASVTWEMVTDAEGNLTDTIRLLNKASKGNSGGVVYMSKRLLDALSSLKRTIKEPKGNIIINARTRSPLSAQAVVNLFFTLYRDLGFDGCSSHSGRRTAITKWARKISLVGGSLRDVQSLARHSSLAMTQKYIEVSEDAMKKVVG
jgi:integrase